MHKPLSRCTVLMAAALLLATACAGENAVAVECGPVENPPEQHGGHLLADAEPPEPYSSVPPSSGWHSAGAPKYGSFGVEDALSEPEQVTVLELGGVMITWNDVSTDVRTRIDAVVASHAQQVAASAYDKLQPGEVALASWTVVQRCTGFDPDVVNTFLSTHLGQGPES